MVRYVHVLTSPAAGELRVGCVCAGRLTGAASLSLERERHARSLSERYETFAAEKHWAIENDRQTRPGRHTHWDYMAIIYRSGDGWRWMLIYSGGKYRSVSNYPSAEAARWDLWISQLA